MKLEGTRKGRGSDGAMVYQFVMGKEEARILFDLATAAFKSISKGIFGLQPTRNRLKGIRVALGTSIGLLAPNKRSSEALKNDL